MHPSSEPSAPAPAPPDPLQAQAAYLDDVMAQAEIAANAQRDLEGEAESPSAASVRQEAPEDDDEDEEDDEEESAEQPAPAEEAPDEPPAEPPQPPPQPEQQRYSRRDAARFATELNEAKQQLQAAHAELQNRRGEVGYFRTSDQRIRQHLLVQSGYVQEANGRSRYENLSEKLLRGTASVEEADEVAQMTSWHEFAGPIYRAAEEQLLKAVSSDWRQLRDLEGVGDQGLHKLNEYSSPTEASRALHAMAYSAGEAKAAKRYEARVAKLEAENKSLKTGNLARSPQPATANGAAVSTSAGFLARAIDPKTGATTDEFDREVAAGKWLGADLSKH